MSLRPVPFLALVLAIALSSFAVAFAATPASGPAAASTPVLKAAVTVHHNPGCGCCLKWIAHLRASGYPVTVIESPDLDAERRRLGVPVGKASCHTAEVGGYFVEGHVPVADIDRLLAQKPKARGLTSPGMPAGSPGMEMPDGYVAPHAVLLVAADGTTTEWSRYGD